MYDDYSDWVGFALVVSCVGVVFCMLVLAIWNPFGWGWLKDNSQQCGSKSNPCVQYIPMYNPALYPHYPMNPPEEAPSDGG